MEMREKKSSRKKEIFRDKGEKYTLQEDFPKAYICYILISSSLPTLSLVLSYICIFQFFSYFKMLSFPSRKSFLEDKTFKYVYYFFRTLISKFSLILCIHTGWPFNTNGNVTRLFSNQIYLHYKLYRLMGKKFSGSPLVNRNNFIQLLREILFS